MNKEEIKVRLEEIEEDFKTLRKEKDYLVKRLTDVGTVQKWFFFDDEDKFGPKLIKIVFREGRGNHPDFWISNDKKDPLGLYMADMVFDSLDECVANKLKKEKEELKDKKQKVARINNMVSSNE